MATARNQNRKRQAAKQPADVSGRTVFNGSVRAVPLMQQVSIDLSYYANSIGQWLAGQDMLAAEALLVLGGLMVAITQDTYPNKTDRPAQLQALVNQMDDLGKVLVNMIVLHKAEPEELYGDLGRS